ncbi:MAG: asparagine synthetase B [Bacteroidetes bacterium]|nr:asparagine synthetase B [Bacteroidota bacterium]MDA1121827.1 asparagine synthetase B [Bacteroidota bacterium]
MKKYALAISCFLTCYLSYAAAILIPMDEKQNNHLKAYGAAFYCLQEEIDVDWLLNYRGGSFLIPYSDKILRECSVRGVSFEMISDAQVNQILNQISSPSVNMNVVKLEKAPRIAVYSPKNEFVEDESDAVIAVLEYAEIPFTIIYDEEVLMGELANYDWLHLHHEDFTGQIYRFLRRESDYLQAEMQRTTAIGLGYQSVPAMKYDVAKQIRSFCASGKYLFAMCSGAETFDIALAADGVPINGYSDDEGDDLSELGKLDYGKSFAFQNFTLGNGRNFSDINVSGRWGGLEDEFFTLFQFSAKWDIVPSLLTQNHEYVIHEFHGLTSAFEKNLVKSSALILGENDDADRVRYIYGTFGEGHWTYYSGHDPERGSGRNRGMSRRPLVELHPNSPGYRLILNNVLFPAAKKKKQKT